ncbi:carbohydrate ABC transporter substrate-binding protein, CUT1 family [Cribrihabitans marinus]|uniref:Carbohydrate ABC transporter substrate-binding protein, CUT1 family n=1 Tax=Cribrihabitans marinus TaxID=1227549 RepID=A0A1H7DCM5_9RHOB|nr:extracellular solute-binding protein [Cribrihabitans marinus]GGH38533.1 sugar ABC transporter substrate-binding protein [Cribrihabitans marinus]SEJ99094.1 carbohydrate ABC transporter substrate-binding protein, CUT1 family [Cribrihabitans marinus]
MKHVLLSAAAAATITTGAFAQEITLGRFFGACEDAGTDTTVSTGEACIIQSIINAADAELDGISINTLPTDWGNYYDQIKAAYAGGTPPDVHVMHRHRIPEFAGLGALAEISGDLEAAGIDPNDWSPAALDAVSFNGGIYGVPMDFHANLWHVNMDVMEEAGLVENGQPVLPSSPEELLAHAQQVKDATGKDYLAADFAQFPIGVRLVLALMWQQNANIFTEDGTATINTEAGKNAVTAITQLFDASLANPQLNYADSQQAFLNGEAAILVNGTWVVDFYTAEAAKEEVGLDNYYVADFPTLFETGATWADSHMWAIPSTLEGDKKMAALKVLAFINDHNIDWARTGHMAVRTSVVESEAYTSLPHRDEYTGTAAIAKDTPPSERYGAIQDVLNRELQAIWLTGKPVEDALSDAELEVQDLLDR